MAHGKNKKRKARQQFGDITAGSPQAGFSNADSGLVKQIFNTQPDFLLNYYAHHAGINTDTTSPFGAFFSNQVKNITNAYNAAVADQPDLSFVKYMHLNPTYGNPDLNGLDPTGPHSKKKQKSPNDTGNDYLNHLLQNGKPANNDTVVGGNGPGSPTNRRRRKLKVG